MSDNMSWTKEERYQLGLAAIRARETGADETEAIANAAIEIVGEAIANAAIEIVGARGGTMTTEEVRLTPIEDGAGATGGARIRQHIAAQGARITILETRAKEDRKAFLACSKRADDAENYADELAKERDALKVECEYLRKVADDAKESAKIMAESARVNSVQLDQARKDIDLGNQRVAQLEEKLRVNRKEIARQISSENVRIGYAAHEALAHYYKERDTLQAERDRLREAVDAHRKSAKEWRDQAFRQSQDLIEKGIEVAQAKEEHQKILAQMQADQRAIHDAIEWAHDWHGKDLPPPSRAVLALIDERDQYRKQHSNVSAGILSCVREIGDLRKRLAETSDLMEAYRKAGMLEHERAEAGERMVAAMRRDKIGSLLD